MPVSSDDTGVKNVRTDNAVRLDLHSLIYQSSDRNGQHGISFVQVLGRIRVGENGIICVKSHVHVSYKIMYVRVFTLQSADVGMLCSEVNFRLPG